MTSVIEVLMFSLIFINIKEIYFNNIKEQSRNNSTIKKDNLIDSKKIVRSNNRINDEFGSFNKIEG